MSKIMKIIMIIISLSLAVTGLAFSAEPQVAITAKWSDLNPDARECGGFSEDSLVLTIKINKKEIKHEFCSSYGKAEAKVIQDTRGVNFLILKSAQGRGTHVTSEYLTIFRIGINLEEYARVPVYEPVGRLSGSHYDYKIRKPKDGGLLFLISVRNEGDTEDAEWLPTEKKRAIHIK